MNLDSNRDARFARPLLGTLVEISVPVSTPAQAVHEAFHVVEKVQRLMSCHDPCSDLSEANRAAHRAAVTVDPWTFDVFRLAMALFRHSGGAFDCTIGGRQVAAGRLPGVGGGAFPVDASGADIELAGPCRVRYARKLHVDFGGIAKGFAVDRAVDALRRAGVRRGVVNAGGDLRVFGGHREPVHVRLPQGALVPLGDISEGALATSVTGGHSPSGLPILDGRGGRPRAARLASVFAESCALADGLTKIVAVLGARCSPLLVRLGAEAVCRDGDGPWQQLGAAAC